MSAFQSGDSSSPWQEAVTWFWATWSAGVWWTLTSVGGMVCYGGSWCARVGRVARWVTLFVQLVFAFMVLGLAGATGRWVIAPSLWQAYDLVTMAVGAVLYLVGAKAYSSENSVVDWHGPATSKPFTAEFISDKVKSRGEGRSVHDAVIVDPATGACFATAGFAHKAAAGARGER